MEQGSKEWLEFRRDKIGASDASCIVGINPWKSAAQLMEEKLGLKEDDFKNEAMLRGIELEPIARQKFIEMTGIEVFPEIFSHNKHKWMISSFDGISRDRKVSVEIKCGGQKLHEMAKNGIIPPYYFCQTQHQIEVNSGYFDHHFYFSYYNNDGVIIEVKKDQSFIDDLLEKEEIFHECYKSCKMPPEYGEKEIDDPEWIFYADQWKHIQNQLKNLEISEKDIRQRLIALSDKKNVKGGGIKLSRVVRKGAIDYTTVPWLEGKDLEPYRKPPVESWRLVAV